MGYSFVNSYILCLCNRNNVCFHSQKLQDLIARFDGKYPPFDVPECPDVVLVHLQGINRKCHLGNLAYCITTSGTTGKPKIVQVPHGCIVPNITHIR